MPNTEGYDESKPTEGIVYLDGNLIILVRINMTDI